MGIGVISISTNQRIETPVAPTVTAANEGLSLSGTTVQLGQPVGAAGNPALITADREIPLDGFTFLHLVSTLVPASALDLLLSPLLISWIFDSTQAQPQFIMQDTVSGDTFGIFYDPAVPTYYWGGPGVNVTCEGPALFNNAGGTSFATAQLELGAGGNNAGQGQLKFRGPNLLTVAEAGVMEYDGTNLFFTRTAGTREGILTGNSGAAAPALTGGGAPASFYGTAGANYMGEPNNWVQVNIGGTNFKIPLYT